MSRRTVESNKAIRLAWQKELGLVQEGKGTRDWTEEQQKDILNPELGKAYDENGRAFEGHHMKSAEAYPEYQGNPENIQFLSRAEHTQAHGGWQKPTNGYYDYITGITNTFNENELIPCEVITLSNPVIINIDYSLNDDVEMVEDAQPKESSGSDPPIIDSKKIPDKTQNITGDNSTHNTAKKKFFPKITRQSSKNGVPVGTNKSIHKAWKFAREHILEIAGGLLVLVVAGASALSGKSSEEKVDSNFDEDIDSDLGFDSIDDYTDTLGEAEYDSPYDTEHTSPCEHEVSGHSQRYHTKEGIVIREKEPYHRGGKKDE